MEKLPPLSKIYEAFSAIADERVVMKENTAFVKSSDFTKEYTVMWDKDVYSSNDNASYWQGYAGYPMIAVLMLQKKLPLDEKTASYFKGINWKQLNTRHKNKYDKAIAEIISRLKEEGIDTIAIEQEVNRVYNSLAQLNISTKRSSVRPPK